MVHIDILKAQLSKIIDYTVILNRIFNILTDENNNLLY